MQSSNWVESISIHNSSTPCLRYLQLGHPLSLPFPFSFSFSFSLTSSIVNIVTNLNNWRGHNTKPIQQWSAWTVDLRNDFPCFSTIFPSNAKMDSQVNFQHAIFWSSSDSVWLLSSWNVNGRAMNFLYFKNKINDHIRWFLHTSRILV
jgi:hypothetical protein